jgi:hypothetical protein
VGATLPRAKRTGRKSQHEFPSGVEIKNTTPHVLALFPPPPSSSFSSSSSSSSSSSFSSSSSSSSSSPIVELRTELDFHFY